MFIQKDIDKGILAVGSIDELLCNDNLHKNSREREKNAVRQLLKQIFGQEKEVLHLPSGKPYLADSSYRISISHSKKYAAVFLHPIYEVGIDIECISDRILRVKERFMSQEELQAVHVNSIEQLLLYWCAKETTFKMMQQSEVDFSKHIHVEPFDLADSGTICIHAKKSMPFKTYFTHYRINKDFVLVFGIDKPSD